ncbi:hypothetical protein BGX31_006682 [Mortierella sp. GBA43]|nr:hypothetical protein BGX31_006682 [Mortierella sp. GBA43]
MEEEEEDEVSSSSLLIVAIQGEGIQLFNTADQKCVLSYSIPPGYSFVGSAQTLLESPRLRNIYAVIAKGTDIPAKEEGRVVWMWKHETTSSAPIVPVTDDMQVDPVDSSSARKTVHKFDRTIHQLFTSPLLPDHVLLTNVDGSISLVTEDLKRVIKTDEIHATNPAPKSSKKEKKDTSAQSPSATMVWATTYNSSESWIPSNVLAQNTLIIMTIVESSAGKIIVTLSYVNEERRGFTTFGQVEIEDASGLSGLAFDAKIGQLSFMGAAGQLRIFSFEVSQGDHTVSASETLSLPLPGYSTSSTVPTKPTKGSAKSAGFDPKLQHVDAVALGDNYLAVAGIHHTQGKAEQTLTIWDIRYGTLQAKHIMSGSFTPGNTTCQLALLPESVLAMTVSTLQGNTVKSDVYLCPIYTEPISLLGAMGRMADTAPFLGQGQGDSFLDAHTTTTTTTTTALLIPSNMTTIVKAKQVATQGADDLEKQIGAAQNAEKKALALLSSESKTSTVKEFEKVFFKHVEHQVADAVKDVMDRFGVDAKEAKAAVAEADAKKPQKKKEKRSREQKTDATAAAAAAAPAVEKMDVDVKEGEKSKDKKKKKKSKAKKSEEEEKPKEAKNKKKSKSKADKGEADGEGSSSDSSSEDDDDGEDEPIVLSSDDEQDEDKEDEDEQEYEINEEQEKARSEAHKHALQEWRKIEAEAIIKYKKQRRLLRAGRKEAPLPDLSHRFVTTVVGRCFRCLPNGQPDMTFWPAKVIEYLIEQQLVGNSNPGAGQRGLVLSLMERGQWSTVELAIKRLYDIPEQDMIVMLKQVIGLNRRSKENAGTAESAIDLDSSVPDTPHFLNLIMAAPRNEIFMQQAIKRLSVEEISVVLSILKGWIDIWDERGGIGHQHQQPDKKQLPGGLPGYGMMVDFATLIMDVHFPSLILSPHLHPTLKAIQQSIQRETEIANLLEQALRGPLGLFDRKHREFLRRKKEASGVIMPSTGASAGGAAANDKRRRRKWEGGEGIPDYAVEIIHL